MGRGVALLAFAVAACGNGKPSAMSPGHPITAAKLPDGPPLVTPGESMSYRVALGGMDLATFDLGVGDITDVEGKRAVVVQAHAKSRGIAAVVKNVDDTFTSWVDVETGRPIRWNVEEESSEKGVERERTDARFDQRAESTVPVDVWEDNKQIPRLAQKVSMEDVWDYNAFLVALRAWEAPPGSTVDIEVFRSRYMWHVRMTIAGEEKLVTELGEFPTLRFNGHGYRLERDGTKSNDSDERDFSIWITNDQGRVPVQTVGRTDFGDIKLSIVDYQPGNGERIRP